MKHKLYLFLIVAASLVAGTQITHAQTITDDFEDGNFSSNQTWHAQSGGSTSVVNDTGAGTFNSNVLQMGPAPGFRMILPLTSTYSLSATNKITVSIQFRDELGTRGFLTRLANDNLTPVTTGGSGVDNADDDMGIGIDVNQSNGLRVIGETGTDGDHFFGSDRDFRSFTSVGAIGTSVHTLSMDYFLDGAGDIQVDTFWDSSFVSSETFSQGIYTDLINDGFNQFSLFGTGGSPNSASYFDNFSITQVPEPSTYALLGLGGGILWFLRRRSKKS